MAVMEGTRRRDVGAATQDLYRQYGKQIYAYCYHRLRSREEAEDAVQTTFMNAFRALQRGAQTQFEQAWLFKIAQNVCIARSSSSAKRLRLEAPNDFEVLQEIVPAQDGEKPVELIGVEEALEAMPENQRRAILLREWQGLSYREIGEELGLSQAAVEMLIFRARRALAGALEQPDATRGKKLSRKIGSAGSLLGALKTLLGGGTAIKAAAVAAAGAIAVVGESAQHTIVRNAGSAPRIPAAAAVKAVAASKRVAAASPVHASVFAPRAEPSRAAVSAGAVHPHRAATSPAAAPSHPSSPLHVRPDGGEASEPAPAALATTVSQPAPAPPAPAVTTVAAAPVGPEPATTTATASPPPAPHPPVAPLPVTPVASTIAPPTTTTGTTTTTTATTAAPTPHDHGRHLGEHAPPADPWQPPPSTTTTTTTTTTTPPATTVTTPAPPSQPPGNGRWSPAPPMAPEPVAPVAADAPTPPVSAGDAGRHWHNGH